LGETGDGGEVPPKTNTWPLALVVREETDEVMEELVKKDQESPLKIQDKKRMKTNREEQETNPTDILVDPLEGCLQE
jgi:hypothetical protein